MESINNNLNYNANSITVMKNDQTSNKTLTPEEEKTKKACEEFEAMLIKFLLTNTEKTIHDEKNSLVPESDASKTYKDALFGAVSKEMASQHALGISDMLYNQITYQNSYTPIIDEPVNTAQNNTISQSPQDLVKKYQ